MTRPAVSTPFFLLILMLAAQISLAAFLHHVRPPSSVLPRLLPAHILRFFSFGDEQLTFRSLGLVLQNAGDSGGRFTPLKDYDYALLADWFARLDQLDMQADYIPALAAYYYALTPKTEDIRHIVTYLSRHAMRDPAEKWRWLVQAVMLARYRVKDQAWALRLAQDIRHLPPQTVPLWTRQLEAFVLDDLGQSEAAAMVMRVLLHTEESRIPPQEKAFMLRYIDTHLTAAE